MTNKMIRRQKKKETPSDNGQLRKEAMDWMFRGVDLLSKTAFLAAGGLLIFAALMYTALDRFIFIGQIAMVALLASVLFFSLGSWYYMLKSGTRFVPKEYSAPLDDIGPTMNFLMKWGMYLFFGGTGILIVFLLVNLG